MHQQTLQAIAVELDSLLRGRFLGKLFQFSATSLAIDFGLKNAGYVFISIDPSAPRIYLIKRNSRELEKMSIPPSPFTQALRANFGGGQLLSVAKDEDERIMQLAFSVTDEIGESHARTFVVQLTGRSANLFLLDSASLITHAFRAPRGEGQLIRDIYRPPHRQTKTVSEEPEIKQGNFATVSAAADEHYRQLEAEQYFFSLAANLEAKLRKEISRRRKLKMNLQKDLVAHGRPDEHKRLGDLLLANISNAEREGNSVRLKDYYAEGSPIIEIEIDENASLQEAASESFSRYGKAKRAIEEIGSRLVQTDKEVIQLEGKLARLEEAIERRNLEALAEFAEPKKTAPSRGGKPSGKQAGAAALPGMRRYRSSDGYEVVVGRSARDNDQLTFKVARPNDLWLHAGDYPGSHVIVRNSKRDEVPHQTIIEAAQLAAKFSQASKDSRVTVHYTRRKFISKPKGAAPGLVRMSSFKSITVEPGETMERL
ncbi:MAG: NFACT family protein [Pyrinomonadaceae bacterium]|nr:NFACT family protein [Pyrinomonadaceae bacterium]